MQLRKDLKHVLKVLMHQGIIFILIFFYWFIIVLINKDLVVMKLMLNNIVKFICFIVLVVEQNSFQLLKRNVWYWILIRFDNDLCFFLVWNDCKYLKCVICLQTPVGDYYQYQNEILCSSCFNFNWQWQEKFKRT